MRGLVLLVFAAFVGGIAAPVTAQAPDAEPAEQRTPTEGATEQRDPTTEANVASAASEGTATDAAAEVAAVGAAPLRPKIAIVVGGDPDDALRSAASRVEAALGDRLEQPFDPGLRAALRGEPGTSDDGLEGVRRERARLGLQEAGDTAVLEALGRRAGARAVVLIKAGDSGPEVHVLDVRRGAFFDDALTLTSEVQDARIAAFVVRRARAAQRAIATPREAAAQTPPAATEPTPEPRDEPDFFEQYWPYLVAAVLLGTMVAVIVATSTGDGPDQPVLRFTPGR